MQLIPKLNLNKSPKSCINNSLTYANNIKIKNEDDIIVPDNSIEVNSIIHKSIQEYFENNVFQYNIKGIIPCNTELILFIYKSNITDKVFIFRYNEKSNKCLFVKDISFNGGQFIGTFTYNINNELIIVFSENGDDINQPLKTINLGVWVDDGVWQGNNDLILDEKYYSIIPEVKIPSIDVSVVNGYSYKGWYFIFIRYKYNNQYTQWYNTNASILVDEYNLKSIYNYFVPKEILNLNKYKPNEDNFYETSLNNNYSYSFTASKIYSDNKDICNYSLQCKMNNLSTGYENYQLGFICVSKTYSKCFKTYDIAISTTECTFNNTNVEETSIDEMLLTYYNYYNVKNIINYNNRLYISNYSEKENTVNIKDLSYNIEKFLSLTNNYQNNNNITLTLLTDSTDLNKGITNTVLYSYEKVLINDNTYMLPIINITDYYICNSDYDYENFIIKGVYVETGGFYPGVDSNDITITINDTKYKLVDLYICLYEELCYVIQLNDNEYTIIGKIDNIDLITIQFKYNNNDVTITGKLPLFKESNYNVGNVICDNKIGNDISIKNSRNNILNNVGILPNEWYNFYIHFVDKYGHSTNGYRLNELTKNNNDDGDIKISSNGLYKIKDDNTKYIYHELEIPLLYNIQLGFKLNKLPDNYIGYFISYEKFEKQIKYKGVSYKNDTDNNILKFYSSSLNYLDKIVLNVNKIKIFVPYNMSNGLVDTPFSNLISVSPTNPIDGILKLEVDDETNNYYTTDLIKSQRDYVICDFYFNNNLSMSYKEYDYKIKNIELIVDENNTYLKVTLNEDIITDINEYKFYKTYLYNDVDKLYKNNVKTLIPCSNINYNINDNVIINTKNSFLSIISTLFSKNHIWDSAQMLFLANGGRGVEDANIINFHYPDFVEVPEESLRINNEPHTYMTPVLGLNTTDSYKKAFIKTKIIQGKDITDIYKQPFDTIYNSYPKVLTNYNEDKTYITKYDKTIRRSNVIQSESLENNWKKFNLEEYKIITENKGNITNLVGAGNLLLVHTEHSLFLFDANNTLKTEDKNVQLAIPDLFDLNYKEVFTSNLGYGGLQDKDSAIFDQFGYIYYDNDNNRFYQFDDNNLNIIDEDIKNWLNKFKPTNVRFAHDKENNRILINLYIEDKDKYCTLSYNYKTKSFISFHDYNFQKGISTKNKLYFISNYDSNQVTYNKLFQFNYDKYGKILTESINSTFNIIINFDYTVIKYLEYIKYKLHKINNINEIYDNSPVEGEIIPYSGDTLRIYNNLIDTDELNIDATNVTNINYKIPFNDIKNYILPYYHLGNWNFNYLRDTKNVNNINNTEQIDKNSRLYGNYFIFKFILKVEEDKPFEFESLEYIVDDK